MKSTLTVQDLELLGYTDVEEIVENTPERPYYVFTASGVLGIQRVEATFVYLKTASTHPDLQAIASMFGGRNDVYVIGQDSLMSRSYVKDTCEAAKLTWRGHEELLWKRVSQLFQEYAESLLVDIIPGKYFVQPREEDDPHGDLNKRLLEFLSGHEEATKGKLKVLSAGAGVGKTTLARHLTHELASARERLKVIPIYVEASHWSKLYMETVGELWI